MVFLVYKRYNYYFCPRNRREAVTPHLTSITFSGFILATETRLPARLGGLFFVMKTIYTNIKGLKLEGVLVLSATILPRHTRLWIKETRERLLATATFPEALAAMLLEQLDERPIRQAFFRIRKRNYFVDFFFPRHLAVVEIDGSSHLTKKEHDRRRDSDFRSIGIRTIRIKNQHVTKGMLYEKLSRKMCN